MAAVSIGAVLLSLDYLFNKELTGSAMNYQATLHMSQDIDPRTPEWILRDSKKDDEDERATLRRTNTVGVTQDRLDEHGITRDEAAFIRAVGKAMNGELDGYRLTDSMTDIKSLYDIDEEKLLEEGFLKRHTGVARRCYYSVTPAGQKAGRITKTHGFTVGDVGDDTPHRVGVELTRQYYERQSNVSRVEISPREDGSVIDLVVVDRNFNRIAILEVEAGSITADPHTDVTPASSGINDYASIRGDYRVLAESEGDSIWVVRNHEIAGTVLRALSSADEIPVDLPRDTIQGVESGRIPIDDLNERHIAPMRADGLDDIMTFQQLRRKLR
ncbi:hypothetical protein KM295_16175 [Natronomonas sp. F2-12]|uniref:Uncharacterized protein n=1 Tax=Natronomonas aquatica TaxID=2841590 RepID=A0A9R1CWP3_9EURY|nr:hypothetical protein [Natronomonas aquatica]MCQ4334989.1 hypothetical protein [Natronomonas aquatica]